MSTEFPCSKKGKKILQNAGVTYLSACAIHKCPLWVQVHSWQPECILCLTLSVRNFPFALFHVNEKDYITAVYFAGISKHGFYLKYYKHKLLFKGTSSPLGRAK